MKELYYEITDNGYHIFDKNDSFFHIYQYEPYIPNKDMSYEENAKTQIYTLYLDEYVNKVMNKELDLSEVPEEYREEVESILSKIEEAK